MFRDLLEMTCDIGRWLGEFTGVLAPDDIPITARDAARLAPEHTVTGIGIRESYSTRAEAIGNAVIAAATHDGMIIVASEGVGIATVYAEGDAIIVLLSDGDEADCGAEEFGEMVC